MAAVGLIGLAACAGDPMGASDGISPVAGLAQRENIRILAVNPYAGDGPGPNPGGSGQRAAGVIDRYQAGDAQVGEAAGGGAVPAAE